MIAPNIAKPTTNPMTDEAENTLFRNSRSGITGSRTRCSTRMNPTTKRRKPTIQAMTCAESQGQTDPAKLVTSTTHVAAPASSAIPA